MANPGARTTSAPVDRAEAVVLRRLLAMCSHLSALAAQKTDLTGIARFLADGIGSGVVVLDRALEVLAAAGIAEPDGVTAQLRERAGTAGLNTVLAATARNRRALTMPGSAVVVAPVSVGDDVAGYLLTLAGDADHELGENMRLLATEHAAMVCGVVLGRELVITAAAGRARQELVEGLLLANHRDARDVQRWAQHLGFNENRSYYVLTFTVAGELGALEPALARLAPDAIVTSRGDEVVAIVPVQPGAGEVAEQGRALAMACASIVGEVRAGIGNPYPSASEVSRSYAEAGRALLASQRMGEFDGITAFSELGIHRLLLRVNDVNDLRTFAAEILGPLLEEEQSTGMEYLNTLAVYFQENSSPRRAAQQLHVHPNTVSYRIRRAESITGLSLDVHRDRLMAEVAVTILHGLGKEAR